MKTETAPIKIAASVKPAAFTSIKLMDFVRAEHGDVQAQAELRLAVIYTAYYHILKAGNRTQWDMLASACTMYSDMANVKTALESKGISAACKRMQRVYMAYGAALDAVGIPGVMKKATDAELNDAAARMATEFVTIVDMGMSDAVSPEEQQRIATEKEQAAKARADKKAEKADAEALAYAQRVKDEARKLAESGAVAIEHAPTVTDAVETVVKAITVGHMLDSELEEIERAIAQYRAAQDAARTAEIAALIAPMMETA